jgi:uncharacterized membrane-anchored protein
MGQPTENRTSPPGVDKRMVLMPLQAGCMTLVVAGVALLVGYLLDSRLGTFPRWTLIVLISSAPLTLGGVYWLVRRMLKRQRRESGEDSMLEDRDHEIE